MSSRAARLNVLALVLASLTHDTVVVWLKEGPPGETLDLLHWSATVLGGAMALFAISGLLPFIWFAISRFRASKALGGIVCWWFLWLISVGFAYKASTFESTVMSRFGSEGCAFQVTFPEPPSVQSSQVPQARYDQAQLIHRRSGLHAECHVYDSDIPPFGPTEAEQYFRTYAELQGLRLADVSAQQHANGMPIYIGGASKVSKSGTEATYRIGVVASKASTMTIIVFGPSTQFPTATMETFWASLRPR
ncbi:MAG: hypothetical protein QF893_14475 [Alphaproteobacteria bacterium]|jgi:hypothetical protein|nr:hypothetical protein [Alphaproteobacteria bacterium]